MSRRESGYASASRPLSCEAGGGPGPAGTLVGAVGRDGFAVPLADRVVGAAVTGPEALGEGPVEQREVRGCLAQHPVVSALGRMPSFP
ncbi:hypothetical protein [Streptomyces lanatus]|uniref:Uncharacterized protein n=1 Tax=Streptomyces lanatus TaxID=66900 RepID=A0ABV1Y4V1_9ACTN|nr:hypothetical protein [Streptomyces lanatus]GHH29013.1 hypothetical protein GCM10018780_86420 [Streptomyces lanatus]